MNVMYILYMDYGNSVSFTHQRCHLSVTLCAISAWKILFVENDT